MKEVEDIIFNLVHDLRVDEMKAKIDRYQKENSRNRIKSG